MIESQCICRTCDLTRDHLVHHVIVHVIYQRSCDHTCDLITSVNVSRSRRVTCKVARVLHIHIPTSHTSTTYTYKIILYGISATLIEAETGAEETLRYLT